MASRRQSVDTRRHAMVPRVDIPRSSFDSVHTHKTTFDAAQLVPVYVDEVLPGDSFRVRMTALCRLATPIVPLMDNIHLESFFFFVPARLLWEHWARFMGEQESPTDVTQFLIPYVEVGPGSLPPSVGRGTLSDWFGIWTTGTLQVNALPYRAYNLIYNHWFRDADLQDPVPVPTDDGPDTYVGTYDVLRRSKRHDYFTSCRPWPEKPNKNATFGGTPAPGGVMIRPAAGAPVSGLGVLTGQIDSGLLNVLESGGRTVNYNQTYRTGVTELIMRESATSAFPDVRVLINDIRTANVVQIMMERDARGGTRYVEKIRSQFGVTSPDFRLQRPEYLGGGRSQVTINPVAQTSATRDGDAAESTVLGELAGIGTAVVNNHGFSASFTEHGYILGLVSVRADLTYQQGLHKMWSRRTPYDFYVPAMAFLGEQAVLSREIYSAGVGDDTLVFGYQERWAEYRQHVSRISGAFRSTDPTPLDMWHAAQHFGSRPSLNSAFITEDPPIERVLSVDADESQSFLFDSVFDIRMTRCLPMFSIPGMGPRL